MLAEAFLRSPLRRRLALPLRFDAPLTQEGRRGRAGGGGGGFHFWFLRFSFAEERRWQQRENSVIAASIRDGIVSGDEVASL